MVEATNANGQASARSDVIPPPAENNDGNSSSDQASSHSSINEDAPER